MSAAEARPASPRRWLDRMFQMRLPVFMVAVAGCALISWAAILFAESRDVDRLMASHQLGRLSSADAVERRTAAQQLDGVPPAKLAETARALVAILKGDPDPRVRVAAAGSLSTSVTHYFSATQGEVPPERDMATLALIAALRDADPRVRASAAIGLEGFSHAVVSRKGKTIALGLDPEVAVGPLRALLDDSDPPAAMAAFRALTSLKDDPSALVPAIRYLARAMPPEDRAHAIGQLAAGLKAAGQPPDELLRFLGDDHGVKVRVATAVALGWHWSDSEAAALALANRLDGSDPEVRATLVWALTRMSSLPAGAVAPLARVMASENSDVRDEAMRSQIWVGAALAIRSASPSDARPALPALEGVALRLGPYDTNASWAIIDIDPRSPEAARVADRAIRDLAAREDGTRLAAVQILAHVGPPCAGRAARPLAGLVADDANVQVADGACEALARLGPGAAGVLPDLGRIAHANFAAMRLERPVVDAIFAIGPGSPEAVDAALGLADLAEDADSPRDKLAAGLYLRRLANVDVAPAMRAARDGADDARRARIDAALKWIEAP